MIPIHHLMKIIQASFREWDHLSPRLPHSRELSKRRKSSQILIRMSLARLSRLCTARSNPLLHQSSFMKTLVERLYSSVLLIWCRHSISILTVRLSPAPLTIGLRICCVGFIKPIKPTVIPANTGEHGVEETDDPTPERKRELVSSSDELGSYPLRRLARRSATAFSSSFRSLQPSWSFKS